MKHIFLFLIIFLQIFCSSLQSQNYQPFRSEEIYIYDSWCKDDPGVDSTRMLYSLRIDSVSTLAGDSLFFFNKIAPKAQERDNIFGRSMLKSEGGMYRFLTSDLDTFLIHTALPVNSSWDFNKSKGISATLTQKSVKTFLGITDSVLTISLSNGDSILISRNYGCIGIKPFLPFNTGGIYLTHSSKFLSGHLTIWGIDGIIGKEYPWFEQIFDWEIGDRFIFESQWDEASPDYSFQRVIDRFNSPNLDSILYTLEVENLSYTRTQNAYGYVGHGILDTVKRNFSREEWYKKQMSYEVSVEGGGYRLLSGIQFSEAWNNMPCFYFSYYAFYDSIDSYYYNFESFGSETYIQGFGQVNRSWSNYPYRYRRELICHENGLDTLGNCFDPLILPNDPLLPDGEMRVFPNPAKDQVRVEVAGITPGNFELYILDSQGRIYSHKQIFIHADKTLSPDISTLSNGLYFLILRAENGQILRKAVSILK